MITATNIRRALCAIAWVAMAASGASCGRGGCPGPELDFATLRAIRQQAFREGPGGFLVIPNPIDATHNIYATNSDPATINAGQILHLPSLLNPGRLESAFIKIRLHAANDALALLAQPGGNGRYEFRLSDPHYSEVMAYAAAITAQTYLDALGFPPVKTRPLYVMVRAQDGGTSSQDVNAFYSHNQFNPNLPRELKVYGETPYAPGMDRDIYYHEFGHLNNESLSREIGMDRAGDAGAVYTEGAALHECIADYLAESLGDKSYMSVWTARNLDGYVAGQPLRSAVDNAWSDISTFRSVGVFDGTGLNPERYRVAEWCSRILWRIRHGFVDDDNDVGPMRSDLLVFTATSLLQQDASISDFERALIAADQALFCGGHSDDIEDSFEARGFGEFEELSQMLQVQVQPVGIGDGQVAFRFSITNPDKEFARNVRVYLESSDSRLTPLVYMQGFGDLPPGGRIVVGGSGLPVDYSVTGRATTASGNIPFLLRVKIENGQDAVVQGVL